MHDTEASFLKHYTSCGLSVYQFLFLLKLNLLDKHVVVISNHFEKKIHLRFMFANKEKT